MKPTLVKEKDRAERLEPIRCSCCGAVIAERRDDGAIVIRSRHHGQTHETIIKSPINGGETVIESPVLVVE